MFLLQLIDIIGITSIYDAVDFALTLLPNLSLFIILLFVPFIFCYSLNKEGRWSQRSHIIVLFFMMVIFDFIIFPLQILFQKLGISWNPCVIIFINLLYMITISLFLEIQARIVFLWIRMYHVAIARGKLNLKRAWVRWTRRIIIAIGYLCTLVFNLIFQLILLLVLQTGVITLNTFEEMGLRSMLVTIVEFTVLIDLAMLIYGAILILQLRKRSLSSCFTLTKFAILIIVTVLIHAVIITSYLIDIILQSYVPELDMGEGIQLLLSLQISLRLLFRYICSFFYIIFICCSFSPTKERSMDETLLDPFEDYDGRDNLKEIHNSYNNQENENTEDIKDCQELDEKGHDFTTYP